MLLVVSFIVVVIPVLAKLSDVVQGIELRNFRRGRRLHSAGRPSRLASAHISSFYFILSMYSYYYVSLRLEPLELKS